MTARVRAILREPELPESRAMSARNRFVAMVAVKQPAALSLEHLVSAYRHRFPDRAAILAPAGRPSEAVLRQLDGVESALTVNLGDIPISIVFVGKPMPTGTLDRAIKTCRLWPEAGPSLSTHTGHVIVASLQDAKDHKEAINSAGAVMSIVSALCDVTSAIGVYWATGETVTPAQRFQSYAEHLVGGGAAPIEVWVGLLWLDGPPDNGRRTFAVTTTGLLPFIGREIEFLPSILPPRAIAEKMTGLMSYLLARGPVIRDGDTVGATRDEKIGAKLLVSAGRPVIQLRHLGARSTP